MKKYIEFHSGEKPSACVKCNKRFSGGSNMTSHIKTHTGEKPYKRRHCKLCDKCFTETTDLKIHKFCHSGEKPLRCQQCVFETFFGNNLKEHKESNHSENLNNCTQCD